MTTISLVVFALLCCLPVASSISSIPQNDPQPAARAAAVKERLAGFLYGPSLIGSASFFPDGPLGKARVKADMDLWQLDREIIDAAVKADATATGIAIQQNGGLKTLDDYVNVLYKNKWNSSNPLGAAPGILTNYTQDLLFSMERLSQNSYPLRRIFANEKLPFHVSEHLVKKLTTVTLKELQAKGKLFYVDHQYQSRYQVTPVAPPRFGAYCSAYFFIHPVSGDFLPLAIKTNVGSDLIYTPLDTANDWLLAKMMFNVNDFFHSQMFHLVVTHDVSEGVHLAALRTLSPNHPVMVILERLMLQGYSSRVVGEDLCFNSGGHWDQLFLISNIGCRQFVNETWPVEGAYEPAYLLTDLKERGLIDENNKYPFKTFPFFDDANRILTSFKGFFTEFVDSYYPSESVLAADNEIQNWVKEVSQGAKVYEFPKTISKGKLVDVLSHFAFIVGVVHHSLNSGDPVGSKATLPFHLNAMYAPVPTQKGVTNLVPFLPPPTTVVHYIGFLATFNRPFYRTTKRTLVYAFNDTTFLSNFNAKTQSAANTFTAKMSQLSTEIRARNFDSKGLSSGMPFVYRTLDPGYIPYFSSV